VKIARALSVAEGNGSVRSRASCCTEPTLWRGNCAACASTALKSRQYRHSSSLTGGADDIAAATGLDAIGIAGLFPGSGGADSAWPGRAGRCCACSGATFLPKCAFVTGAAAVVVLRPGSGGRALGGASTRGKCPGPCLRYTAKNSSSHPKKTSLSSAERFAQSMRSGSSGGSCTTVSSASSGTTERIAGFLGTSGRFEYRTMGGGGA
jgi:hypothetical protein